MEGRESAIDSAWADERGGRIALVDKDGSKTVAIFGPDVTCVMMMRS